jgi:hypothetical protein
MACDLRLVKCKQELVEEPMQFRTCMHGPSLRCGVVILVWGNVAAEKEQSEDLEIPEVWEFQKMTKESLAFKSRD